METKLKKDGSIDKRYTPKSQEIKDKIRNTIKEQWRSGKRDYNNAERIAKISKKRKETWDKSPEQKRELSEALKVYWKKYKEMKMTRS